MKRLFILLLNFLLIISCNKDDMNYLSFITAGQTDGTGIKFTDIVPDNDSLGFYPYPTKQIKYLDLNNDHISDFELISTISDPIIISQKTSMLEIKPLGKNFICITKDGTNWVKPFKYADTIGKNNNWSDSIALLYYSYYRMGDHGTPPVINDSVLIKGYWLDNDSIYIGVNISKNNYTYFGWIDMKKNTIRQYAITIPY